MDENKINDIFKEFDTIISDADKLFEQPNKLVDEASNNILVPVSTTKSKIQYAALIVTGLAIIGIVGSLLYVIFS